MRRLKFSKVFSILTFLVNYTLPAFARLAALPREALLLLAVSVADSMEDDARLGSDVFRAKKQQVPSKIQL